MTDFRLRTFLEVYRKKSFTRAAEALHITQPAVSQHVRYLEDDVGHELFIIQGKAITLTREGEILLRFAESVEADEKRTRALIDSVGCRTSLRIGATRTIGEYVMPDCVAAWAREFPDTEISLLVENSDTLFRGLHLGELDFLFVEGMFDRGEYASEVLMRDAMIPVCAPSHALASARVDFGSLFSETLIVRERGSGSRLLIERHLASENRNLGSFSRVIEIGNIGAIKRLVASGAGIAFLYERSVARELAAGDLARVSVNGFSLSHDYSFVFLPRSMYEREFREFFEHCRSRAQPSPM